MKKFIVLLNVFAFQQIVFCESNEKTSLVFVIDDTGSMMDDIDQVKTQVDKIFDSAINSNTSVIEDFIIVTFNDPAVEHRTTTKEREVFKKALNGIVVNGGGDCPEMALTGLELALQKGRNGSTVYLFTDADAKDVEKEESVKKLAEEKHCRLIFMLTGTCSVEDGSRPYHRLAEATGGQVFSLFKKEVGQVLEYAAEAAAGGYSRVAASFADVRTIAAPEAAASAIGVDATTFTIDDDDTSEVLISVSGVSPVVEVTGPDGTTPKIQDIAKTSGSTIFKILEVKKGTYAIRVSGPGATSIVVDKKGPVH